jgi:hypothetical protein
LGKCHRKYQELSQCNLGYQKLKHNKQWFDDKSSKVVDQRKQATLQLLQNPHQAKGDNMQSLRRETSRICRNKKMEYMKGRINDLETNNKNKNIRDLYRGINALSKGTNLELIL